MNTTLFTLVGGIKSQVRVLLGLGFLWGLSSSGYAQVQFNYELKTHQPLTVAEAQTRGVVLGQESGAAYEAAQKIIWQKNLDDFNAKLAKIVEDNQKAKKVVTGPFRQKPFGIAAYFEQSHW